MPRLRCSFGRWRARGSCRATLHVAASCSRVRRFSQRRRAVASAALRPARAGRGSERHPLLRLAGTRARSGCACHACALSLSWEALPARRWQHVPTLTPPPTAVHDIAGETPAAEPGSHRSAPARCHTRLAKAGCGFLHICCYAAPHLVRRQTFRASEEKESRSCRRYARRRERSPEIDRQSVACHALPASPRAKCLVQPCMLA